MGCYLRYHLCNPSQDDPCDNCDRYQRPAPRSHAFLKLDLLDLLETLVCDCRRARLCTNHAKKPLYVPDHGVLGTLILVPASSTELRSLSFCWNIHVVPNIQHGARALGL